VSWRTAGTAIALAGGAMMVAAIVAAWPNYYSLLGTGSATAVLLMMLGFRYGLPALHVPSIVCGALAFVLLYHMDPGDFNPSELSSRKLWHLLASGATGVALISPAVLAGLAGLLLQRTQRKEDGFYFLLGSGIVAAISLVLASWFGAAVTG